MRPDLVAEAKRLYALGWPTILGNSTLIYQTSILYQKIKGKPPCCVDTALQPFYLDELPIIINNDSFISKKNQLMKTNNFKLKDTACLYVDSLNDYITNANLTDANAVAYLKENPKGVSNFEKLPSDLQEFIDNFVPPAEDEKPAEPADIRKMTKNELLAYAKELKLPEDEYKSLNKEKLLQFITDNI